MKNDSHQNLPVYDIHQAAYLNMEGIPIEYEKHGSRVTFMLPATQESYQLLADYNENPKVGLLEFVSALRRVRSQMLSARDGHENGKREREGDRHDKFNR